MADIHATARPRSSAARVCTILAFVFAVIAIFFLPPLFMIIMGPAMIQIAGFMKN